MLEPAKPAALPASIGETRRPGHIRNGAGRQLILALTVGLPLLGGCAIPFGGPEGPDSSGQPTEETPRDRNRLYLQEQERMERQRTFDRVGPSDH